MGPGGGRGQVGSGGRGQVGSGGCGQVGPGGCGQVGPGGGREQVGPSGRCRQAVGQGGEDVGEQRFGGCAGLLRTVQHGDGADRPRQRGEERLDRERPVEPHRQHPDLLAVGVELGGGLGQGAGGRAHHHDHPVRVRGAGVLDQVVGPPGQRGELVEHLLHHGGHRVVERVRGLGGLEEGVRVLRGAADRRVVGGQPAGPMRLDVLVADQAPQRVVRQQFDGVDLVGGAEPVEEVQERHPGPEGGGMGDRRQVLGLLHPAAGQHRPAGLADGHHVGMVTEDAQRMGRDRAGRDVDHRRGELPGDLVHVRDHQQQTLRRGERRGQRALGQGAVQRPRRAALGLHLDHLGDLAPDVRTTVCGPLVRKLSHAGGRGDGVDRDDLAERMRDAGRRLVPLDGGMDHLFRVSGRFVSGRFAHRASYDAT
ncbi:hypothetical protein SDC9_116248 [bioreactor metagenome]|uniref:Uncharacterized protein n=1 Tax=bioreactor metagenome TaxID=1076179 RepID=A0A645C1S7_9ZZZZ